MEAKVNKLISVVLTLIIAVGSAYGLLSAADYSTSAKDTPVAQIPNDSYMPYYTAQKDTYAEASNFLAEFTPVRQTVTVMSTPTGYEDRGNYIPAKPVKNALVRLDGVPRYTDFNGQVTATLSREYVELFVEKDGYNPYIEIIEATGGEKVVYLKQPNDDIEIYSVMFCCYGEAFNLMIQPCYYLKHQGEAAGVLTVTSNVEYDYIWFYANGELIRFGYDDGIVFTEEELDAFGIDDKFALKISYQGVMSKAVSVRLIIEEFDSNKMREQMLETAEKDDALSLEANNDESGVGDIGTINVDKTQWWEVLLDVIVPESNSISFDPLSIKINFIFDVHKGTIQIVGGFEISVDPGKLKAAKEKAEKESEEYKETRNSEHKKIEEEMIESQKQEDLLTEKLKELNNGQEDKKAEIKKLEDELAAAKRRKETGERWKSSEGYRTFRDANGRFVSTIEGLNNELNKAKDEYKNIYEEVINAENSLKNAKNSAYNALKSYLKDKKGFKQKAKEVKNLFKKDGVNGGGFNFNFDFSAMAQVTFSYRTGKVQNWSVFAELQFKPSYTYQWFVPSPIGPIPIFIKVEGLLGIKAETFFTQDSEPIPFFEALSQINLVLQFGLRIDGGLGIEDIASVGIYGKVQFDWQFYPEQNWQFMWGAGVKLQFLIFEVEFGYTSPPKSLSSAEKNSRIEALSLTARASDASQYISRHQLYDRIYQGSRPQLIQLNNERQMLLWIEDDEARDTYNRSVIKYSIKSDGLWGEPKAVFDDGRGDHAFDVYHKGDEVYVAAQRSKSIVTGDDTIYSVLGGTEIFVSKFNTTSKTFDGAVQITDNDVYDAMPQFAVSDGLDVALLWQSNTANDYLGQTGENIISCSFLRGNTWSPPSESFKNSTPIYSYSAASVAGTLAVAVCEDIDGDILTPDSQTSVTEGQNINLINGTAANPQFIALPESIALLYYNGAGLMITTDYVTENVVVGSLASSDYNVGKSGDLPVIFYEVYRGGAEQGYAAIYDQGKWTSDISVTDEVDPDGDISAITGLYYDGTIYSSYNYRIRATENSNETPTVLCAAEHRLGHKIETEAFAVSKVADGAEASIRLYVENSGDFEITAFTVELCGQKKHITLNDALKIGEGRYFDVTFDAVFGQSEYLSIVTRIVSDGGTVLAESEYMLFVKYTDIKVNISRYINNGKQQISVDLSNVSDVDSDIRLTVCINGKAVQVYNAHLGKSEYIEYQIIFDKIEEGDFIYIAVDAAMEEFEVCDNTAGFYSLLTEGAEEVSFNPYWQILQKAKQLV